ncbi:hypothetical protein CHELA20_52903 [Hyphomicrobiales bacterium]|nr:hypothetical protein CHELA41_22022 [Hyphomicrobiales bacterium]CAH1683180.1 hypothetical protein CHELA20_52903 [Hyphomicrobiales bacterium]
MRGCRPMGHPLDTALGPLTRSFRLTHRFTRLVATGLFHALLNIPLNAGYSSRNNFRKGIAGFRPELSENRMRLRLVKSTG